MLLSFFFALREGGLKPTVTEFLTLLEALQKQVVLYSLDDFYVVSRACLVKDETKYDRFDQVFAAYWHGVESVTEDLFAEIPEEWLRKQSELHLSDEDKAKIESLGGLEELIEQFKERLEEQKKRHSGGNKWIGTEGTSPFGNDGYHPEGIRVGGESKNKRAVKVWDRRDFKNLDDGVELGTRNIKIAMRRLRKFARTGATEELDLDDTIKSTARNAGLLDIKMVPERHNAVKVQVNLSLNDAAKALHQTCRFVLRFTSVDDRLEWRSRCNSKRTLVDRLVSGIQFRDDEVAGGAKGEHARVVGIVIGAETWESRQQAMVQVDNPSSGELPAGLGRQDSHVSGKNHQIDIVRLKQRQLP